MENDRPRERPVERFIEFQKTYQVIPPDDVNLPTDRFWDRRDRRKASSEEREAELKEILSATHISPYFKSAIAEDIAKSSTTGFTSFDMVEKLNKIVFGIDLENNELGIFTSNPQRAFEIELAYWEQAIDYYVMLENENISSKVNLDEWEEYLDSRRNGKLN